MAVPDMLVTTRSGVEINLNNQPGLDRVGFLMDLDIKEEIDGAAYTDVMTKLAEAQFLPAWMMLPLAKRLD